MERKERERAMAKRKATNRQKAKVAKVMGEYKRGTLRTSAGSKPSGRDQAIAIALSEAGMSKKRRKK